MTVIFHNLQWISVSWGAFSFDLEQGKTTEHRVVFLFHTALVCSYAADVGSNSFKVDSFILYVFSSSWLKTTSIWFLPSYLEAYSFTGLTALARISCTVLNQSSENVQYCDNLKTGSCSSEFSFSSLPFPLQSVHPLLGITPTVTCLL